MQIPRFLLLWCFVLALPAAATDLRIENVTVLELREQRQPPTVTFDIAWENGWRNDRNHDAAWVFFKMLLPDGGYQHLQLAQTGHRVWGMPGMDGVGGDVSVPADGAGLFLVPAAAHRGPIRWRVQVTLAPENMQRGRVQAFGVEMVQIPAGPFFAGDPGAEARQFGSFFLSDARGQATDFYRVQSEAEIPVGAAANHLYYETTNQYQGDQAGPVPAAFPKGHRAFYVMKYELRQGQYADFLNTLPGEAATARFSFGGDSYDANRGTIRQDGERYVAAHPTRPLNYSWWDDGLAFADWAGLRPMTELEFAKASRGPERPQPNAFPWGTADRDQLVRTVGASDSLMQVNGWGEDRLTDATRPLFGASYYWVMDLAGSVWERVISIGLADGRAFTGTHGDGQLDAQGQATNPDWPHTHAGKEGHGYRGGGFYDHGRPAHEFNPHSPTAYRRFGGWAGPDSHRAYGFRAARTAP